jgi:hypothetical protein
MLFFNKPLPTYQFVSQNLCLHRRFERSAVFLARSRYPGPESPFALVATLPSLSLNDEIDSLSLSHA